MSRVGKSPVYFDKTVQVSISPSNEVMVKGPKHSLSVAMLPKVKAEVKDGQVILSRLDESAESKSLHGLYRALIQNAVTGVSKGWTKILELNGVGYRAAVSGKKLELTLGLSHPVVYEIPQGIEIAVEKQTRVTVSGPNRDLVGQVATKIKMFRPPEPYLGKGIKFADEKLRRKAGKSASK